jgi:hypothetical protein
VWGAWGVWGAWRCGRCGGVGSLLTFDIPQTALVATLDTYDFMFFQLSLHYSTAKKQIPKIVAGTKSFGGTFSFSNCQIIGLDNDRQ